MANQKKTPKPGMSLMSFTLSQEVLTAVDRVIAGYEYPIHRTAVIRRALSEFLDTNLGPSWRTLTATEEPTV